MSSTDLRRARAAGASLAQAVAGSFAVILALTFAAPDLCAAPFSQSRLIIEINATDGDAGVQLFVDGDGWTRLEMFDPGRQRVAEVVATGGFGLQGFTELFIESAEPSFEEQSLLQMFARFPEGQYTLEGVTVDGKRLSGRATFKHNVPAGPVIIQPAEGATVNAALPVVVDWDPVTAPFPGTSAPITIAGYQVIVERLSPQPLLTFSVSLPASATQVTVSPEFFQGHADYRIEVLAIEASGNQTITERDFSTQ